MKQTVIDVLIYLFDHYVEDNDNIALTPNQDKLKSQLIQAGFGDSQVNRAFDWLEGLAIQSQNEDEDENQKEVDEELIIDPNVNSFRVYTSLEEQKLNLEAQGFIFFLQQAGVLSTSDRELIIDRVMALDEIDIDMEKLKWVILMVLFNRTDNQDTFNWIEDLVTDGSDVVVH